MSELKSQEDEAVIGTCNICGRTVATVEDLPKHLTEARRPGSGHRLLIITKHPNAPGPRKYVD